MRIRFNSVAANIMLQEQMLFKKIEFAQIKRKIEILATFLPNEILRMRTREWQRTQTYVGVLLFVGISGLQHLGDKYNKTGTGGIYELTAILNAYIGALIETATFFGGDILEFNGRSFIALWKVQPDESLFEVLHEVVGCALIIQNTLNNYETSANSTLRPKLALSCGNMTFAIIGDELKKVILVGDAVFTVKQGYFHSQPGEFIVSTAAWAHMLQDRYEIDVLFDGYVRVKKIYYRPNEGEKRTHYDRQHIEVIKLIEKHMEHKKALNAQKHNDTAIADRKINDKFIKSLPVREEVDLAPRNWIVSDLQPFIIKLVTNQINESQPVDYLTEMREATVQHIQITPTQCNDTTLIALIENAHAMINDLIAESLGVLVYITCLHNRDVLLLVLFGLRGINHELESQAALRISFKIKSYLMKMSEVRAVTISVVYGILYCGVLGHPTRREYIVIGTLLNKGFNMLNNYPDKITCDMRTFKSAKLASFYFQLLTTVTVTTDESHYIFEYNENMEKYKPGERKSQPLVGRNAEFDFIRALIEHPGRDDYYGVCFMGSRHSGRSTLLQYAINQLKLASVSFASLTLDVDFKIPYYCISKLYGQIYDNATTLSQLQQTQIPLNLPRELFDTREMGNSDIAMQKYKILNCFRDLVYYIVQENNPLVLFIDNFEYIDQQSWEILRIIFRDKNLLILILTGDFQYHNDFAYELALEDCIKMVEMRPLTRRSMATIACQRLNVAGIPKKLTELILATCSGLPGLIHFTLLHMLNSECILMKLINREHKDRDKFDFPDERQIGIESVELIAIVDFSESYKQGVNITLDAISLDIYDSFTPYQQLVIKTASVLGNIFTRTLLIVALKYPSESLLSETIKALFEEGVFHCGSNYIYGRTIDTDDLCCRCYFEDEMFFDENESLPKYAYCKMLHFKNKEIRNVAYNLLPGNQKKELHLLCTDVIESMNNHCPKCLREPFNNFITMERFKTIVEHCNNPNLAYNTTECEYLNYDNMKDCIRRTTNTGNDVIIDIQSKNGNITQSYGKLRPLYDPKLCNCFEILAKVFKDLIYHSHRADHLGKQIFFTVKYGQVLICLYDIVNAIAVLSEARELCLIEARLPTASISENFRRYNVGKISAALADAMMELRQLKAARNQLAIALRQYNIPTLALTYKQCRLLLHRNFLVNIKTVRPFIMKNSIMQQELGRCLIIAARLFAMEGNWPYANLCSIYALYVMRHINANIPIIFETYCNVIDTFKYGNDSHMCEKLQRYITREIQLNYANDNTVNMYALLHLVVVIYLGYVVDGKLDQAILTGYRVLDLRLKVHTGVLDRKIFMTFTELLLYNCRFREYHDLWMIYRRNLDRSKMRDVLAFYTANMSNYLQSGLLMESIDDVIKFARTYYADKTLLKLNWSDHLFRALIHLHYMRLERYTEADAWRTQAQFFAINVRRTVMIGTLYYTLQAHFLAVLHRRRNKITDIPVQDKEAVKMLALIDSKHVRMYRAYEPLRLCLLAWRYKLNGANRTAQCYLNKCRKVSRQQGNVLYGCFAQQLESVWRGGYYYPYARRPATSFRDATEFTDSDLARFLHPFLIK